LSGQCSGITSKGSRCTRSVEGPNGLCWLHDPTRSEERRRAASKAGKSKPNRELSDVKNRIREMIADVRDGTMDRADAAVCGQLYNTLIRTISVELRVKEQEELIARLEALEEQLETKRRNQPWGA
jgi:hypothetical protein